MSNPLASAMLPCWAQVIGRLAPRSKSWGIGMCTEAAGVVHRSNMCAPHNRSTVLPCNSATSAASADTCARAQDSARQAILKPPMSNAAPVPIGMCVTNHTRRILTSGSPASGAPRPPSCLVKAPSGNNIAATYDLQRNPKPPNAFGFILINSEALNGVPIPKTPDPPPPIGMYRLHAC